MEPDPTGEVTVDPRLVPENGFSPLDFPALAVTLIPYNASAVMRADPHMTVREDGWMYIETGNVRIAIPDREEWSKLVMMGERLWNTHEAVQRQRLEQAENHDGT